MQVAAATITGSFPTSKPGSYSDPKSRQIDADTEYHPQHCTSIRNAMKDHSLPAKPMDNEPFMERPLLGKWDLYYHLPQNKSWDLASYKLILGDITTVEKLVAMVEGLSANVMKYCMLFVMRKGITPMWEDPKNRNGGFFSYKVANKFVPEVWKTLFYALCGETLSTNPKYSPLITGITVSPKKSFCIIKIWLTDMSMQDGGVIIDIPNLTKNGVVFKPHKPEF